MRLLQSLDLGLVVLLHAHVPLLQGLALSLQFLVLRTNLVQLSTVVAMVLFQVLNEESNCLSDTI